MVGEEVSRFLLPLLAAAILALAVAKAGDRQPWQRRFALLGATLGLALLEVGVYSAVVLR